MLFFHKELYDLFDMSPRTYKRRIKELEAKKVLHKKDNLGLTEIEARVIAQKLCFEEKFNLYVKKKISRIKI